MNKMNKISILSPHPARTPELGEYPAHPVNPLNRRSLPVFRGSPDPYASAWLAIASERRRLSIRGLKDKAKFRSQKKEPKSRFSIFKIFIPIFKAPQIQNNAMQHKLLKQNAMRKNALPKCLPQLSEGLRLDGRTVAHCAIFPNNLNHYRKKLKRFNRELLSKKFL
jgi:hypothetical protein